MQLNTFQKANNMTTNTKIIIGVGAIALAYYLFKDKFALYPKPEQGTSSGGVPIPRGQETPSTPSNTGDSPKVYYCKDGFKKTIIENKNIQNIRYANPCEGHGGIDELKTNGSNPSQPIGCGTPTMCKSDEVFVDCRCQKKTDDSLRKACEKKIDDAIRGGGILPAMPREGLIRNCLQVVKG
jgi:hypothetical protein